MMNLEMQCFNVTSSSTPKPTMTPPPASAAVENNLYYPQAKFSYQSPQIQGFSLYSNYTPAVNYTSTPVNYYNIDPSQYHYQQLDHSSYYQQQQQHQPNNSLDSNNYYSANKNASSILSAYETNANRHPNYYTDSAYESSSPSVHTSHTSAPTKPTKLFTIDAILSSNDKQSNKENEANGDEIEEPKNAKKGCARSTASSKRVRTIFTQDQLDKLEVEFMKQQYMVGSERYYLANELNLNEAQVKIWFQNRRIKWRKENVEQKRAAKFNNSSSQNESPQSPLSITNDSSLM